MKGKYLEDLSTEGKHTLKHILRRNDVEGIYLTEDRVQLFDVVNTIVEIRVRKTLAKFFVCWETISFSSTTPLELVILEMLT